MAESDILDDLNNKLNIPVWWHDFMGEQAVKVDGFDPEKAAESLPRTEVTAAAAIAHKFKNILSYTEITNRWYLWDGRIHVPCDGQLVAIKIAKFYYEQMCDALEFIQNAINKEADKIAVSGVQDADKKAQAYRDKYTKTLFPKHREFRDRLATDAGLSALIRVMKSDCVVPSDYYENDQRWFVTRSHVVDIDQLRFSSGNPDWSTIFLPHDPSRPVTKYFDADYVPSQNLGHWDGFLRRSIPSQAQRDYLQMVFGAAFMGNSKLRCIINVFGPPGSGKSILLGTMFKLGREGAGYVAMPDSRALNKVTGQNFEQDAFRGRRVVGISEPSTTEKIDDDFLKKYSGDEWVETRTLNVKSSGWVPQGVIFVASNATLKINTRDKAIVERLQMIEFPIEFQQELPGFEGTIPEDRRMIPGLEEMIMEDRSRILTWILIGMVNFVKNGQKLNPPEEVTRKGSALVTESSSALRFIEEYVLDGYFEIDPSEDPEFFIGEDEIYQRYQLWAASSGERTLSKKLFLADIDNQYNVKGEKVRHNNTRKLFAVKATLLYRQKYAVNLADNVDWQD